MHMANPADVYGEHIYVRYCHTEYDIVEKFSQLNRKYYNTTLSSWTSVVSDACMYLCTFAWHAWAPETTVVLKYLM